jgi:hypothetical protein
LQCLFCFIGELILGQHVPELVYTGQLIHLPNIPELPL